MPTAIDCNAFVLWQGGCTCYAHSPSAGLFVGPGNSEHRKPGLARPGLSSALATVTNALDHEADIAKVQEWLGHANIATTRIYDRRKMKPEDSPTFKVVY
jgi:hypothetical protein